MSCALPLMSESICGRPCRTSHQTERPLERTAHWENTLSKFTSHSHKLDHLRQKASCTLCVILPFVRLNSASVQQARKEIILGNLSGLLKKMHSLSFAAFETCRSMNPERAEVSEENTFNNRYSIADEEPLGDHWASAASTYGNQCAANENTNTFLPSLGKLCRLHSTKPADTE